MPIPIPIGQFSILQFVIEGRLAGQQTISTFTYKLLTTGVSDGIAAETAFLAAVVGAGKISAKYLACCSEDLVDVRYFAQWVFPTRLRYVIAPGPGDSGTFAGASMPPNVTQVITRQGDLANRHSISNTHIPAVPVSEVSGGFISDDQVLLLDTLVVSLIDTVVDGSGQEYSPVAFRRDSPALSEQLDHGYAQPTARILRRRTVGLGS